MVETATTSIGSRPQFLAPFRRITSSGKFIPEIDGLRFFAIVSVYIYHLAEDVLRHSPSTSSQVASNWLFSITQILNVGVPLFFVISGFILALPFAEAFRNKRKPVSLKKYFLRRVTRLEPPYFLCLFLFFVLKIVGSRGSATSLFPHLLASLFYLHNVIFARPSDINMVAWSLEIEVQFYILAPVLALVFALKRTTVRRGVLVGLILLFTLVSRLVTGNPRLDQTLLAYAQYFLTGYLLIDFYLSAPVESRGMRFWDAFSLGGWILLLALLVRGGEAAAWLEAPILFCLFIATFRGIAIRRFATNPWITTIGGMCYSIYLLHNYAIAALGLLTERFTQAGPFALRLLVQFCLMTPLVLICCALYFRLVERPCMRPDWYIRLRLRLLQSKADRALAAPVP